LERLTHELNLIEQVQKLVHDHLSPIQLYNDRAQVDNTTIRKLALRVSIKDLIRLAQADYLGRINLSSKKKDFPAGEWLMEEATKLSVHERPPQPFLKGRHLIELGLKQGPSIGPLLKQAFDAQMNGQITSLSDALLWAKKIVLQEFNLEKNTSINSKKEITDQT
jgi:tRNA nucleotidyltransferase (CCA-adding enzyme)